MTGTLNHNGYTGSVGFSEAEEKTPDKPFKGSFNIRISPELHRALAARTKQKQKSLNAVIRDALEAACR